MIRKRPGILRAMVLGGVMSAAATGAVAAQELTQVVTTWENRLGARIGVVLRDTSTDWEI